MRYEMPETHRPGSWSARIDTKKHVDGRWMWAISYSHDEKGRGYAPLPKWGNFASSEDEALHLAIAEMRDDLRGVQNGGASQIRAWLVMFEQPSLFSGLAMRSKP